MSTTADGYQATFAVPHGHIPKSSVSYGQLKAGLGSLVAYLASVGSAAQITEHMAADEVVAISVVMRGPLPQSSTTAFNRMFNRLTCDTGYWAGVGRLLL
jgi:hypothetical protein